MKKKGIKGLSLRGTQKATKAKPKEKLVNGPLKHEDDPLTYIPAEKFHYPGRPNTSIPPQVWTQPEPKVVCVAGCFHCSYRRYYGTMPPAVAFNRMWCSHCGVDRIFIPLPKSQWDSYAGGANDSVQTNKEDPSAGKDS